jgi:acetoacetyl-CoA synthetase
MDRLRLSDTHRHASAVLSRPAVYDTTPERIASSQMTAFTAALQAHTGKVFADYSALHDFSVQDFRAFWQFFLHWTHDLDWSGHADPVCVGDQCERASFFPQVQLNYANNVLGLSIAGADAPALSACHADGHRVRLTRGELRERVERLAQALSQLGLREGDRVAGVLRNDADAVVTVLAVTALGATMSTAAPEMGTEAILERFGPLTPRMLFAHTAARAFDTGVPVANKIADLAAALPSLQAVVNLDDGRLPDTVAQQVCSLDMLEGSDAGGRFVWRRFPFNHPLFIMFSSGTTGRPKCIVHGAGGVLLEHLKEHRLHSDLRPGDRMYFHTSCAWMMWNWQLSALASGVEIVTYDGPISTVETLWRIVADEQVTAFGTSPAYLKMCEDVGLAPARRFDLSALRAMFSTGAVLFDEQFRWVRDCVKPLQLQSISGGTDILGCFVLGNPNLPVYAGEAQCKSLAMNVMAWKQDAHREKIGQLVCTNPFPSRPLGFFNDPDGLAFHAAYFAINPDAWTHGDLIEFTSEGTARLHGRFDGVLNVRGINVGPGEIYLVLNSMREIREAVVVQQRPRDVSFDPPREAWSEPRMVLLLVLQEGFALTGALVARIRRELSRRASPAHVPDVVIAVDELPVTHNGKQSEAAARAAVNGLAAGNTAALRNPQCLDAIRNHVALTLASRQLPPPGESREQLERYLQAQWENLFGFAPIGRNDSFFELGGHSLLAARLLNEVHRSTGRTVPLATLLIAPTIASLAAAIEECAAPSSSPVLVRAGTGAPLFIVHGQSGTVMECWALVAALHSRRPVYGLQAHGLDGEEPARQRVEDMATSYIEQMRTVQPGGPYAVAGYSFGGLVALEIAQQLLGVGERMELLCLLDTYVHQHYLPWHPRMQYWRARLSEEARALREVPAPQRLEYLLDRLATMAGRTPKHAERMPYRTAVADPPMPPVLRRVRDMMRLATATYRPRPYDGGPIVYVRALISQQGEYGDPMPLWRRLARRGLLITEIPGSHNDLIAEPDLRIVAAALDRGLTST